MGNKCSFINFCPRAARANTEKTLKNTLKDKKKMNKLSLLRTACKWRKKDDSLASTVPATSEAPLTIPQIDSNDESAINVNGTDAVLTNVVQLFEIVLSTEPEDTSDNVYAEETGNIISENGMPTPDAISEFVDDTPAADVDGIAVIDPVKVVGASSQFFNSNVEKSPVSNDHALKNDRKIVYLLLSHTVKHPDTHFFTIQARFENNYGYGSGTSIVAAKINAVHDLLEVMNRNFIHRYITYSVNKL